MSFPNEIWFRIWSQPGVTPRDLANVCLTSTHVLHVARTVLYRSVNLRSTNPATVHTLELLDRDPVLARAVTHLTLYAHEPLAMLPVVDGPCSIVNFDALPKLTGLKCLKLLDGVFATVSDEMKDAFVDALGRISLEELSINQRHGALGLSSAHLGRIKNLKKLEWGPDDPRAEDDPDAPLWGLLSSCASSLTTLSLLIGSSSEREQHDLFGRRFPHLRSLILGNWAFDVETIPEFNTFIIAHSDTLEHLDLEYGNYDEYYMSFVDNDALTPNSLHRLHEFRGNTECVRLMAKSRMKCLTNSLTKLTVGPGGVDDPTDEVRGMFNALRASGGLRALKELDLDLSEWEDREREDIAEAITTCAQVCPSLEVWNGTPGYSVKWTAEELGDLFGKFKMLRVINLPMDYAEFHGDIDQYVGVLAASCSVLEEVKIIFHGLGLYGDKHFAVERHGDDIGIKSVFET
ncbi:hypothetical protein DFH09DRAFT_1283724 [Mycena vulgaris]|nr:hypothetical protein DFH09DRAFT_1283724 [Mycena vulgaris]